MSIFTSLVSQAIPFAGESVTIRKLSPAQLAAAKKARQLALMAEGRELRAAMGPELAEAIGKVQPGEVRAVQAADPLGDYDRATLLQAGITGWTFADVALSPEAIADMEDDAQDTLARAILRLSKPSLFQTEAQVEADRKNA